MPLIDISRLRLDGGTQQRAKVSDETVAEYSDAMLDGAKFPPVKVVHDGKDFWLWDGFTTVTAAKAAGAKAVAADIKPGTHRDAFILSLSANTEHGQRRTSDDKHKAVLAALQDDELSKLTNREIARLVKVSHSLVNSVRTPKTEVIQPTRVEDSSTPNEDDETSGVEDSSTPAPETSTKSTVAAKKSVGDDGSPGPVTVTRTKVVGNVVALTAERDSLAEKVAELGANLAEAQGEIDELTAAVELGDVEKALREENKKLRERLRIANETIRGLTDGKNEAVKLAQRWKRKAEGKK